MKIMLDAGHGYNTPGKRSPDGMREYEFNRVVAQYAKQLLENHENVTVYFAHSETKDISLQERTSKANRLNVDCYVSIHANAYGTGWNNVRGIETFVYTSRPKESTQLAQKVQSNLVIATGLPNRGVKTANFHVLRETKMAAILVECGFMTNKEEVKLLRSDIFRKTCAEAIVKGLREQYKLKLKKPVEANKEPVEVKKEPVEPNYTVQVGPIKAKEKAEELVQRLKKEGFEATLSNK